jgi:hypothetical protein
MKTSFVRGLAMVKAGTPAACVQRRFFSGEQRREE